MCVYFIKNECVRKTLSPAVRKQRRGTQDVAAITAIQLVSDWNWAACLGGLLSGVKARGVSRAQRRQTITNFQDEARVQHLNK